MIRGVLIILSFLITGEMLHELLNLLVPGNILGMLLIFFALRFKVIQLEMVKPVSDQLLKFLPLFFIPYAVGLIQCKDILEQHGLVVLLVILVGTLLTLLVTGFVQQKLNRDDGKNS